MINSYKDNSEDINISPLSMNTLTLEPNSVLIVRLSKDGRYDMEDFQRMYNNLKEKFPLHSIFMCYDDVEFMAIHDKAFKPERITLNDDTQNYY